MKASGRDDSCLKRRDTDDMTQTQMNLYKAALERALSDGCRIAGKGTMKANGATVYAVTSSAEAHRWYLVSVRGLCLTCNCPAGQHNRYCKHRALVRAAMIAAHATTHMKDYGAMPLAYVKPANRLLRGVA
jgi:hypothetical protein